MFPTAHLLFTFLLSFLSHYLSSYMPSLETYPLPIIWCSYVISFIYLDNKRGSRRGRQLSTTNYIILLNLLFFSFLFYPTIQSYQMVQVCRKSRINETLWNPSIHITLCFTFIWHIFFVPISRVYYELQILIETTTYLRGILNLTLFLLLR